MPSATLDGILVVLAVVGGLELVDRTSFALIALSARTRAFGAWAGGTCAFLVTTGLAVGLGSTLVDVLGPRGLTWLRLGGGIFLIGYAAYTLRSHEEEAVERIADWRGAFTAAFLTILLLELGDTTMIFEIVFVPTLGWLAVLVGGAVGLAAVAAFDVWLGRRLAVRLDPRTVTRLVSVVLFVVGGFTILYALEPRWFPVL